MICFCLLLLSAYYKQCRYSQCWPNIHKDGNGVHSSKFIPKGTIVCNYGGTPVVPNNLQYWVDNFSCFTHNGEFLKVGYAYPGVEDCYSDSAKYLIHTYPEVKNFFGPYLSRLCGSPNLQDFVYLDLDTNELDMLFFARRDIPVGIKLGWDFRKYATPLYGFDK